ncbi:hypothetical protein JCM8547_006449 [Rhodosporidiobolus lusitaniae]
MADSSAPSTSADLPPTAFTSFDDSAAESAASVQPDDTLARGIRALALKKWSEACDLLAQAVEAATEKNGDLSPLNVEPLVLYGKALLGSAIAQSAVLGGGAPSGEVLDGAPPAAAGSSNATAGPSNPHISFSGDVEDDDDDYEGGEGEGDQEEEGEGVPGGDREDDLESAFQVLDLARTILGREVEKGEGREEEKEKLKERLADVHRMLGDVATESEQFDSAVTEYTSALSQLSSFLPPYDRSLSELHMLIALALDFVPNATSRAVSHAEKAKAVLVMKVEQLERVLGAEGMEEKEKEKARREVEDIKGLMGDVDMKIEDLRTIPTAPAPSASDTALEALLRDSMNAVASAQASGTVNDLSGLVKKKKKPAAAPALVEVKKEEENGENGAGAEKRKAEEEVQKEEGEGKKQKVEEEKA